MYDIEKTQLRVSGLSCVPNLESTSLERKFV
jgi:hypothetical protein